MARMVCTMMVRIFVQFFVCPCFLRTAAQPRIDEAALVAVQHQMAQQAAFAQIPDAVKRVRTTLITNKERRRRLTMPLFLAVHCPLPSSCFGEQPRRDNSRLRQRLEPTHGEALCENRMARSGGHRSPRQRRFVSALILLSVLINIMQTNYSSSFTESYTTDMCTLVYNPTSTTASTLTRIAANSLTIY